jgi:hypothetical protein
MPKNVTQWANNDVKTPAQYTPATKNAALWTGDITKNLTAYTPRTKSLDSWNQEHALQTYFYDSNFSYDSDLTDYDYLVNSNNFNQRGQTAWSPA